MRAFAGMPKSADEIDFDGGESISWQIFSGLLLRENTNHMFDGIVVSIIQCLL